MAQIHIQRGDNTPLNPHFNTNEFYSKSVDAPAVHPFHSELVDSALYLRDHYNTAWRITSTFRTEREERQILNRLGVPFFVDVHMDGEAYDSQPAENGPVIMADLTKQFLGNGPVYQDLRQMGINGFGLYDTFIHLDVRSSKAPHRDSFGLVAHWDSRHHSAGSPWGVAFANQKKNPVRAGLLNLTPSLYPHLAGACLGASLALASLHG